MELAIDIGNTLLKLGVFSNGALKQVLVLEDEKDSRIEELIDEWIPTKAIVSTVSKNAEYFVNKFNDINWVVLNRQLKLPFINNYKTPQTLGLDRVALVAAAASFYKGKNVLVIDAGTCVTYDFLNSENKYLGGSISPGLEMRLKSMNAFTSKLPLVALNQEVELTASSTEENLQSGALHGLVAEIDGMILNYKLLHKDLIVVLSGGNTKVLARLVKSGIFARQNFLLEGLHAVLTFNT